MTERLKSFRLYTGPSLWGPKLIPVVKYAPDYTEKERAHFCEVFRPRAERYRLYSRFSLFIGLVIFVTWIILIHFLPQAGFGWACAPVFAGIIGLALYDQYKRPRLECPACRNQVDSKRFGTYCPECGSEQLKSGSWLSSPACGACGKSMWRRRNGRRYKIRACTHCGVFLDGKGI
jgi:hypothetical protein